MNNSATQKGSAKSEVIKNFSKSVSYYSEHAKLQEQVAKRLIASLEPWVQILPAGPIIELGCGTGFVSKPLCKMLPSRELQITDISSRMVEYCHKQIDRKNRITFNIIDAENAAPEKLAYSMSISNFVAHWFRHPAHTLSQWLDATKPGGLLLAAFPGNQSFPEWKEQAENLGIPYTGNELPDIEEMVIKLSIGDNQVDYYEDTVVENYSSADVFFEHLKKLGAGTQKKGRNLTEKERKLLINNWDEEAEGDITVSYHIVFIAVKRG